MSTNHTFCSKSEQTYVNKGLIIFVSSEILHDCCLFNFMHAILHLSFFVFLVVKMCPYSEHFISKDVG